MIKYGNVKNVNKSWPTHRLFYCSVSFNINMWKFPLNTYLSWVNGTQRESSTTWIGLEWFNTDSASSATKRSFVSPSSKEPVSHTVKNIYKCLC